MSISEPYKIDGGYAVKITRRNGAEYRATSPDYQSIVEYRNDFLEFQKQKQKRKMT